MTREPYKKGTTVYASCCTVYKVSAKFNMSTSHCAFVYTNTHDYISFRCVYKHDPVARWYSLGQHFEVWKDSAEARDKFYADRGDIGRWRSHTCWCCVMFYRATVDWLRARMVVRLSITRCDTCHPFNPPCCQYCCGICHRCHCYTVDHIAVVTVTSFIHTVISSNSLVLYWCWTFPVGSRRFLRCLSNSWWCNYNENPNHNNREKLQINYKYNQLCRILTN